LQNGKAMITTLGAHSPKIESARELLSRKGRRAQGRFAFEGATMLGEALRSGVRPESLFVTPSGLAEVQALGVPPDVPIYAVPERAMGRLSDVETPPGIVGVVAQRLVPVATALERGRPAVLLAGVADPGNAGTLLRSAEIFGFGAAIFGTEGVEPFNPKVVRASMGAIFRLDVCSGGPEEVVSGAEAAGYSIVATSRAGVPLPVFSFTERSLIAVGNERHGVASWLPRWDQEVSIPHIGAGESLNAAAAGSILFYAFSQRERGLPRA
jgi:TrmH family RNA methyltransferase